MTRLAAAAEFEKAAVRLAWAIAHSIQIGTLDEQSLDSFTREKLQQFREAEVAYLGADEVAS